MIHGLTNLDAIICSLWSAERAQCGIIVRFTRSKGLAVIRPPPMIQSVVKVTVILTLQSDILHGAWKTGRRDNFTMSESLVGIHSSLQAPCKSIASIVNDLIDDFFRLLWRID